jgi:hypothetical protein
MTVTELLDAVQFVVDAEGKRQAVQLPLSLWEELVTLLEDIEDTEELEKLGAEDDEFVEWEQAKRELRAEGLDV